MKCVIIDDEPLGIKVLAKHVKKTSGLELVRSFENAFEALYFIQTQSIDLVFLDIQMPGVNGLKFIKILKYPPKIIITSAYQEYALSALELGVTDYLLKPIGYDRFLDAVSKAIERDTPTPPPIDSSLQPEHRYFYIREHSHFVKVFEKDILFLNGNRNYSTLQLRDRSIILSGNLTFYLTRLSAQKFCRVHKSYIVALDCIEKYNADTLSIQGMDIPIGRTYKRSLMNHLQKSKL